MSSERRKSTRLATRGLAESRGFSVTDLNKEADDEEKKSFVTRVPAYRDPLDPTVQFLYKPHSLALLFLLIAGLLWAAFFHTSPTDTLGNATHGVLAACAAFVLIGVTQLGDGPFIRPHPAFWRLVLAVSMLYLLALIVILFQTAGTARQWMRWLDPALGVALDEKSYAADCALTWPNILDKMDMFVPAHLFGWVAKALILRDAWLCWIISIMFEVMEYSLEFQLPNFGECWWDHWILDVLLCNWMGIELGMLICRWLAMRTYNWRSIRDLRPFSAKLGRSVAQLTPRSWTAFDWASTRTLRGYIVTLLLVFFFLLSELNCFYLKALLWIPPPHWINSSRVVLHGLMGMVAVRELYQYFADIECTKIGTQLWVTLAIIIVETLISIKFGAGELSRDVPQPVLIFWAIFSAILVLFPIYRFGLRRT